MRPNTRRLAALMGCIATACVGAGLSGPRSARGIDLIEVLPAALDQPQINVIVFVGDNELPQWGETLVFDPNDPGGFGLGYGNVFTITAYLDTGASGILLSNTTKSMLNIPIASVGEMPVIFSDVGVAGSDDFLVSESLRISLANFYPRTDLDEFADAEQTIPIITPYTPLPAPVRVQVGPYVPTVENPVDDLFGDILDLILDLNSLDVVGMPAMTGRVMVMDPTRVDNFDQLFDVDLDLLSDLPDISMRTYLYDAGTPYRPATKETDPGIPMTDLHVKLTYGSFERFTTVSPAGAPGPVLTHNPFIGKDPVAIFDGTDPGDAPGIKIMRETAGGILSSEGNWLLDTGAAASILSRAQAAAVGVTYQEGTFGTEAPVLVDENGFVLPDQFVLTIGGVGGQATVAGFYLDTLLIRTMEGNALNDDDPLHLRFFGAPVLVGDITVMDPLTQQSLTLDGIFGMNFLVASVSLSQIEGELFPSIDLLSTGNFEWITYDEPNGIMGLSLVTSTLPTILDSGTLQLTDDNMLPALSDLTVSGGTLDLNGFDQLIRSLSDGGADIGIITNTSSTAAILTVSPAAPANSTFGGSITGNLALTKAGSNTLVLSGDNSFTGPLNVQGGTLRLESATALKLNGLVIASDTSGAFAATLDVAASGLILQATDEADKSAKLAQLVAALESSADNPLTWTGTGITSSTAAADPANYGIGLFDNDSLGKTSFGGRSVDANSLLVSIAHVGDANLDNKVDIVDLAIIANHWQQAQDTWSGGDLNYDGVVDIVDLATIANNWQKTSDYGLVADAGGESLGGPAAVPEPASLMLMGGGALALLARRRKRG